jgi:hypothetical protein
MSRSVWVIENDSDRSCSCWHTRPPERWRQVITVAGVLLWDGVTVVEGG